MYSHTDVKNFQKVLKPLVEYGAISNEIFTVALDSLRQRLNNPEQSSQNKRDRLISVKEAADILGYCTKTIYRLVDKGTLRRINCGTNAVRFKESDILALVNSYYDYEEEVIPGDK